MKLWISIVCVVALSAESFLGTTAIAAVHPNLVFIFADDWGWGDLSCHGNQVCRTPNIDRLAAEGTDFHQFTVGSPVCSPSRTALMTGHFPGRYRILQHFATVGHHQKCNMPDWLDPEAPLLPKMLQRAGYATSHFGKWHLTNTHVPDAPLPAEYGYDEYGAFNLSGTQMKVGTSCDRAVDFIRRHRDQPFFINLWIHETHTPHYPRPETVKRFSHLDEQRQVYAAVVADGDERIGKVLKVLDELELTENTLVIFSSDNGPEFTSDTQKQADDNSTGPGLGAYYSVGETGGLRGRKRSLFSGGIRTPFIARWPGKIAAGTVNKKNVITAVDMLPTLLAVAGVEPLVGYDSDGENVLPALLGVDFRRSQDIYWEWPGNHRNDLWPHLGVRRGPWKLLLNQQLGRVELFNIDADWKEENNLADAHADVVEQLSRDLAAWKATLPGHPDAKCFSATR